MTSNILIFSKINLGLDYKYPLNILSYCADVFLVLHIYLLCKYSLYDMSCFGVFIHIFHFYG